MTKARLRIFSALLVLSLGGTTAAAIVDHNGAAEGAQPAPPASAMPSPHAQRQDNRPPLLVIGDSFVAGAGVAYEGETYPALLADATDMRLMVDGQGGTGFINDARGTGNGHTSKLIDRLAADGEKFPDASLVVIDAGRNDLRFPIDQVGDAASEYLNHARAQWPTADIVVVVPTFITPDAFERYEDVRNRLENSAAKIGAIVIDPIAEGWYDNVDVSTLLAADRVHPNSEGALRIADRMEKSLRSLGLVRSAA
ncbi:lysophospholipase L1-like esterase [Mycolicibacterium rhodesiae NBB3]|uniref:Lysophospholipase L1-like esterase n=1 Tax=Mycolicibacterium rhodesiae (strain NBB3) TaxID=710685 RepID=G8RTL0_MYCRN|nr:SGNH/GDSL hydrolase family protein [Mycolicibacterium rhodesiae]AEV75384.1 lysophospholipase L1-like esterase [Mycolicibacterium rhodesiae NBB3]